MHHTQRSCKCIQVGECPGADVSASTGQETGPTDRQPQPMEVNCRRFPQKLTATAHSYYHALFYLCYFRK